MIIDSSSCVGGQMKSLFAGIASSFFGVFSFDQGEVVDVGGGGIWGVLGP